MVGVQLAVRYLERLLVQEELRVAIVCRGRCLAKAMSWSPFFLLFMSSVMPLLMRLSRASDGRPDSQCGIVPHRRRPLMEVVAKLSEKPSAGDTALDAMIVVVDDVIVSILVTSSTSESSVSRSRPFRLVRCVSGTVPVMGADLPCPGLLPRVLVEP